MIDPIGTSATVRSGHSSLNIFRLVAPCSADTPFDRAARRSPISAMLNVGSSRLVVAPEREQLSIVTPHSPANDVKYFSNRAPSNWSIPADTGVWVVNTLPARTASTATANGMPAATCSRMRSRPRNPAWPSLVWKTSGSMPRARSARTPPMPSMISWRSRWCESPP